MNRLRIVSGFLTLMLLALSFGPAGSAAAASAIAPAGAGGNAISVRAQDATIGRVIVDSVSANQPAWLLIRRDANGAPGTVLGTAAVPAGQTSSVVVNIRTTTNNGGDALSSALWATLAPGGYTINPGTGGYDDLAQRPVLAATTFASTLAGGASGGSNSAAVAQSGTNATTGGVTSPTSSGAASGAGTTGASPISAPAAPIAARAQDATNGQVSIDSVNAAQAGWLLIRRDQGGAPGQVLGFAPVYQGLNSNIRVAIRTTNDKGDNVIGSRLWATLAADPNALSPFTSPGSDVLDFTYGPSVAFGSNGANSSAPAVAGQLPATGGANNPAPATSPNQISVRAQDTNNGRVTVDSVNAAQDGWLLIRRGSANGQVLGFAPVHAGMNNGVSVSIRTTKDNGDSLVTRSLWATLTPDSNALLAFASPSADVQNQGSTAAVAFSSTLAGGGQ